MKNKIKEVRKSKGITQKELAEMLGIKPPTLSQIENGNNPKIETLEKVSSALGCYVHELIETEETKEGLLTFDSPEEFDAYRHSMLKNIEDLERSKLDLIIEPASKLNDTGIVLLSTIANTLTTVKELTKDGHQVEIDEIVADGE